MTFEVCRSRVNGPVGVLVLRERVGWWVASFLASALLTGLQMTTTAPFKLASLDRLAHFQATEPFQCRILVPAFAAAVQHILPLGTRLVFALIELIFWVALIVVAYQALDCWRVGRSELMRRLLAWTVLVPMAVQLMVPELHVASSISMTDGVLDIGKWRGWPLFYYPYDLPAAVFTLLLVLMLMRLRERVGYALLIAFFALFALATLNRETTIFLLPCAMLLCRGHWSTRQIVGLVLALLILFLAIEIPLYSLFDSLPNPNRRIATTQYESHLLENLGFFQSPFYVLWFVTRFAGGFALVALFWWRFVGRSLQSVLIGFALPLFIFGLWVGRLPEHRIFSEIVPLIWLSALHAIHVRANHAERPR